MFMHMNAREKEILGRLCENSTISVQEISKILGVSQVTIRSDLHSLERKGILLRIKGGGLPAFHPEILERQKKRIQEKRRIAQAAANLLSNGDTIIISDGTTTSLIPKYLLGKQDIRLVTNSTLLLPSVRINPLLHAILIGGEFKPNAEAVVGSQALAQLENYYVKFVFVGTGGFSIEKGLTTHLQEGAEIIRKMTTLGDKIVLVADSSKYDHNGFVKILPLEKIDIFITDKGLDTDVQQRIRDMGIELIVG